MRGSIRVCINRVAHYFWNHWLMGSENLIEISNFGRLKNFLAEMSDRYTNPLRSVQIWIRFSNITVLGLIENKQ